MKTNLSFLKPVQFLFMLTLSVAATAQINFTNSNNVLHSNSGVAGGNTDTRSGCAVTVNDMNNDGLDDVCKLSDNGEVRIEYQQAGGTFTYTYIGTLAASGAWAMCAADVDKNGYKDVLAGYGSGLILMKIDVNGSMNVTTLPNSNFFVQNINFMDVNSDGWMDIFACDDNSYAKLYLNDGAGSFPAEAGNSVINFDVTPGQTIGTSNDDSGNYGSVWTDFDNDGDADLFVAHCRQSVTSSTDARRINKLYVNNGNGVFTENAAAYGLAGGDQDWTASFGDINNDGDFDLFLTKHDVTSRLYTNNGSGTFASGNTLAFGSMPMQSQFEDLDNDGFVDLIITGDDDHRIYHNNQNGTFTDITPAGLTISSKNMLSFATGDLNHDGKIDIYGSYGTTYNNPSNTIDDVFWKNTSNNSNNFITLVMLPTLSNNEAAGARAFIYGAWGVQTREVRSGESYGTLNSGQLHFGLGTASVVDSVVVNWPSGVRTVIVNPIVNQFLNVSEQNPCALSGASITSSGQTNLCTGGSVTLSAPTGTGYTYTWSNGDTTSSIVVNVAGTYAVTVNESSICHSTSPSVTVTVNADETPAIFAASETTFCEGGSVTLSSTSAAAYSWSNGETTQTIGATQTGDYFVTIQGACQNWTSNSISVTMLASPAPSSSDVTISVASSVTLNATGNNLNWYDVSSGGTILASGSSYTTPVIDTTITYYVDATANYGGSTNSAGQKYHTGGSMYSGTTFNSYMMFNTFEACTLKKVKVFTDTPGNRIVELRSATGTVLQSVTVNIPADSSWIDLNFVLGAGQSYQIGTNGAQNLSLLGTVAPRLQRSSSGVNYPYVINGLLSINDSENGPSFYYYFYDWQVEVAPTECISSRTPVTVFFSPTGINSKANSGAISVFPNPSNEMLHISLANESSSGSVIELKDVTGRIVYTSTVEKGNKEHNLNIIRFATGTYVLSVTNESGTFVQKVVFTE